MRNLSSMIVRAWDARFEGTSPDPRNSNTLSSPASTTAALAQEAWSVTQSSKTSLELRTSTTSDKHDHHTILLAAETSPTTTKPLDMVFKGDHYEVRIATAESTNSTRTRDDLEIRSPYTAADLKAHARTTDAFMCVSCGVPLIKLANITRYNDLPSEHWAELLDAWMCHQDQSLSEELIAKGNNIWPKDHQALLSSTGIIVSSPNASSWTIASELEVSRPASKNVCATLHARSFRSSPPTLSFPPDTPFRAHKKASSSGYKAVFASLSSLVGTLSKGRLDRKGRDDWSRPSFPLELRRYKSTQIPITGRALRTVS